MATALDRRVEFRTRKAARAECGIGLLGGIRVTRRSGSRSARRRGAASRTCCWPATPSSGSPTSRSGGLARPAAARRRARGRRARGRAGAAGRRQRLVAVRQARPSPSPRPGPRPFPPSASCACAPAMCSIATSSAGPGRHLVRARATAASGRRPGWPRACRVRRRRAVPASSFAPAAPRSRLRPPPVGRPRAGRERPDAAGDRPVPAASVRVDLRTSGVLGFLAEGAEADAQPLRLLASVGRPTCRSKAAPPIRSTSPR